MSAQPQVSGKKQQDLQVQYSNFKNMLQQIAQKIGDIEQEAEEHNAACMGIASRHLASDDPAIASNVCRHRFRLVLETIEPLQEDRKCFRLINGVLVERTVKDIVPALKTNQDGLKKVLDDLVKNYKTKQDELDMWKKKNNVQVVQQ
ncbi:prefoldin subunit 2 [Cordyceps militaris CM01]|uniref:Prefoldin subunit 2 n=1 Tax=Cordyceps militaris (strain CM01) TaxID=983644 RepID=G3JN09_CORMM|nr:prefoldin subunit 2 [Cordyceps militaris CM01]EGX90191.1 prefoldin subunit 2 [Cordyceps militaris CM01]